MSLIENQQSAENPVDNEKKSKTERLKQSILIFLLIAVLFGFIEVVPVLFDPARRSLKSVVEVLKKRAPFMLAVSIGAAIWIPMRGTKTTRKT